MNWCSLRIVGFCCCLCFLSFGAGDVCLPTWTSYASRHSIGGTQHQITSLEECIVYCEYQPDCVAIDFDSVAHPPCWIHTNSEDLVGENVYDQPGDFVTQYVINRTCTTLPAGDCQLNWTRTPGIHSLNGQSYGFWTEYDCFTFCRYTPNCVAADFDIAGSPACWIHTSYDDIAPGNTYDDSNTVVQYQMNRSCPKPSSASIQAGRCIGQPLRNGSWCPPGKEIYIVSAWYKIHPLCCNSPTDSSDPPDSPTLAEFDIFSLDDTTYIAEILACESRNVCSVTSKSYSSSSLSNLYCPQQPHKTNFVSLTYTCVELGHTRPSTTRSVTSFQFPTQSSLSTQATGVPPFPPGANCLSTWTRFANRYSFGGTLQQHISNLQECIVSCQLRRDCLAIDFDTSSSSSCWIHTNPDDLVGENVYDSLGEVQTQYVINRTCTTLPTEDCQLNWTRTPGIHSLNGQPYGFWTEYDCFTFCRYTPNCVAADFDIAGSPACWIHTSYDDITPGNTYDDSNTVVQYQMNRICPKPSSANNQVSRCVDQSLRSGSWCSPGEDIHIISASYKIHPLCCNSPADNSDPPDSPTLIPLNIFSLGDSRYIAEIEACEGKTTCSLISRSYESKDFNNNYCPNHFHKTNFVSLTYSCVKKGHSDPSTTANATSLQFSTGLFLPTEGTHRMTTTTPDKAVTAAMVSSQENYRDALILAGVALSLAIIAILTIVIVAVLWYRRRKEKEAKSMNHVAMNPIYNGYSNHNAASTTSGESTTNGRYSGSPFKEITTVAYPEDDTISS